MACTFDKMKINLYIDGELGPEEARAVEAHLEACPECEELYRELKSIREMLEASEELELPEGYEDSLHERLLLEAGKKDKRKRTFRWKPWVGAAAALLVAFVSYTALNDGLLMGRSVKSEQAVMDMAMPAEEPAAARGQEYGVMADGGMMEKADRAPMDNAAAEEAGEALNLEGRKIIRNGYVNLEVENFQEVFDRIVTMTEAKGGFVENSNTGKHYYGPVERRITLMNGYMRVRIPEASFLEVYNGIKELGDVTDSGMGGDDVTFQYNDVSSQIENLKIQESRLREIMERAENVTEILEVERELNRVRTDIDRLSGMIKNWDNLVSYSTINVSLTEVAPKSTEIEGFEGDFWEKAKKGFVKSINQVILMTQSLFVWLVAITPFVAVLGLLAILIAWLVRSLRRKRNK